MKTLNHLLAGISIMLCGALTGCVAYVDQPRPQTTYVQPAPVYTQPPIVETEAPPAEVVIRTEEDFYEPLAGYGRWEVVGSYGRCWVPARVDREWRPYSNGHWERTDAGWYWVSDEPWGWATYHYGRWDFGADIGWYWVPQTQWAPAWVSWHEGGGYVGWAPLHPSVTISVGGFVGFDEARISPRAYVFVEQRRFLEPIRPATVVVNNTTIINQTVNITNVKVVNNTVINEGPRTQVIEQASGRQVRAVPAHELRRQHEAPVVARQKTVTPSAVNNGRNIRPPVRTEAEPSVTRPPSNPQRGTREAAAPTQEPPQRFNRDTKTTPQVESQRRAAEAAVKAQEESRRDSKESERAAELKPPQRAIAPGRQPQAEAPGPAIDLENKARLESQRRANEAESKAQAEARGRAKEAERTAELKAQQQHAKELESKTRQESQQPAAPEPAKKPQGGPQRKAVEPAKDEPAPQPRGKGADHTTKANPGERGKPGQNPEEPRGTNTVNKRF